MPSAQPIADKTVIVTGGTGRLGRSIAETLSQVGARVFVLDREDGTFDDKSIEVLTCDLCDEQSVLSTVEDIAERAGPIFGLVNAVGWIYSAPLLNIMSGPEGRHSAKSFRDVLEANLVAPFITTSCVAQHMMLTRTRGVVVNISSIAAAGNAGQTAYSAAKAGVNAMTTVWAKELGAMGIRCVCIAPGFIDTQSTSDALETERLESWKNQTPLRRLGTTHNVVDSVLFAFENDFLNGTIIGLNGGLRL